jgi:hypothetical protein
MPLPLANCNLNVQVVGTKKRKKSIPQRSIDQPKDKVDRSFQRIIKLDVYSAFNENPSKLLGRGVPHSDSESDSGSQNVPNTNSRVKEIKPRSAAAVQSACKVLPDFIIAKEPESLDLSPFKETKGAPAVSWKGTFSIMLGAQPLLITSQMPEFHHLTPEEIKTCATLRISPQQYLEIKRTMLTAVNCYGPFKKREAQTWFRIDVNKVTFNLSRFV